MDPLNYEVSPVYVTAPGGAISVTGVSLDAAEGFGVHVEVGGWTNNATGASGLFISSGVSVGEGAAVSYSSAVYSSNDAFTGASASGSVGIGNYDFGGSYSPGAGGSLSAGGSFGAYIGANASYTVASPSFGEMGQYLSQYMQQD